MSSKQLSKQAKTHLKQQQINKEFTFRYILDKFVSM